MYTFNNAREKRAERARLLDEARVILDKAESENRDLTGQERQKYDGLISKIDFLAQEIGMIEGRALDKVIDLLDQPVNSFNRRSFGDPMGGYTNAKQFSLVRAINAMTAAKMGKPNPWAGAERELEISESIARSLGRQPEGLFVPLGALGALETRDLVKGTASAGGDLVATDLLGQSFIDLLRNKLVVRAAGATILSNLVGDVAIPRQTGAGTAYWLAESGAPTESQQSFDQVPLSPKTVGAFTDISRKLLKQSSIDVEAFVRGDLASVLGLAIDFAALHGTGSSNQPLGIANTSGIGSVVGGTNGLAPDWSHIVGLESEVAIDNADIGRLAYVTNSKVRGKLKQTETATGNGIFVWQQGANPLNGYNAPVSNQVRSDLDKGTSIGVCSAIFFGNWADLIIGMWGVLDILVDPYTGGTSGTVRVIAMQDVDIAVRHPESFAAMVDALTT